MDKLYLASLSPRRAELLNMMHIDFEVCKVEVPENVYEHEKPHDYSRRIVKEKLTFAQNLLINELKPIRPILSADTEVIHHGKIYGKPKDYGQAFNMLKTYSGQSHLVLTTVGIAYQDFIEIFTQETWVYFSELTDRDIETYLSQNAYLDKAGAYGIQSSISQFIEKIDGCYYSVMGLPLNGVRVLLKNLQKEFF